MVHQAEEHGEGQKSAKAQSKEPMEEEEVNEPMEEAELSDEPMEEEEVARVCARAGVRACLPARARCDCVWFPQASVR